MKWTQLLLWFLCGSFFILGILIYLFIIGYSFSAYICLGISAVCGAYGALSLLWRRNKRLAHLLRLTLTCVLALGLLAAAATAIPIARAAFCTPAANCEYIIVLGAGLHGSTPSMTLSDRINAAAAYLQSNPQTLCVVSGGQGPGEDMTEAACMQEMLLSKGIDPGRILMEDQATSTQENLLFSLRMIAEHKGAKPASIGILSSEYHVFRACLTARQFDIEPVAIPASTCYKSLFVNYFLREIPAVWYYQLAHII